MSIRTQAADRAVKRADNPSWPFGLGGVITVGLLYGLACSCLRLLISDNLSVDDTQSNVYTQTLELGYVARQPPLYEWLLWLVQHFTGPTLPSFLILKYGLLTATFAFLYLVAKRIFADSRWVTLAALSPLMLYQFAWNLHEGGGSTQTIALTCAVAASMWSFMRLAERGSIGNYLLFGLTSGLGLISKYNFAGFIVVLLASALRVIPEARIVGLHPRYAPPLPADAAPKVAVVWREGMANHLPTEAGLELAGLLSRLSARPERVRVPWRRFMPPSAEHEWAWMVVVANLTPPE